MRLATKRLVLRPFTLNDVDNVHRYSHKESVTKYMEWGPNTLAETEKFVKNVVYKSRVEPRYDYDFIVTLKDGTVIGACSINFKELSLPPSLGWVYDEPYWNNGYGTEVGRALLLYAFNTLKVRQVFATCDSENKGSSRIMEKIGMRFVKEIPQELNKLGKRLTKYYEVTALEYRLNNHKTFI